ncbi:MAG: hypothetical protein AB8F34_07560, partial [Akkermansiaceae bacterium]
FFLPVRRPPSSTPFTPATLVRAGRSVSSDNRRSNSSGQPGPDDSSAGSYSKENTVPRQGIGTNNSGSPPTRVNIEKFISSEEIREVVHNTVLKTYISILVHNPGSSLPKDMQLEDIQIAVEHELAIKPGELHREDVVRNRSKMKSVYLIKKSMGLQ